MSVQVGTEEIKGWPQSSFQEGLPALTGQMELDPIGSGQLGQPAGSGFGEDSG